MKRIIILCDGTWNRSDSKTPTNVVKIARAITPTSPEGIKQIPLYFEGVGSGRGATRFARASDIVLGGAFGVGILGNMEAMLRALAFAYEPGDEVFIFGFSRGAYTARSFAGLLRCTGIPDRQKLYEIPAAIRRYQAKRSAENHPDHDESHCHRANISPNVATSQTEVEWRMKRGHEPPFLLRLKYIGVWDTVAALGIPMFLPIATLINGTRFKFHDARLTSLSEAARHAVAIDERRRTFPQELWKKVGQLDFTDHGDTGHYRQVRFAGDHGSVGGGGKVVGLSNIAMRWILEGASEQGLHLDAKQLKAWEDQEKPSDALFNSGKPPGLLHRLMGWGYADRTGPSNVGQVHHETIRRFKQKPSEARIPLYRPPPLAHLEDELISLLDEKFRPDQTIMVADRTAPQEDNIG
ncbi:MAG: DUF2235 domain-containing protein [Pseudomonadota bacterium]